MPKLTQYTKGSIIYFGGDKDERIFILNKGAVNLTSVSVETQATETERIGGGEFFGVKSALGHFPREETATAVVESTALVFTVAEFEKTFSSNKPVLMKMLRVFSKQLRDVHRRADMVLKTLVVDKDETMLATARSFYADGEYVSCCDVCSKIAALSPNSPYKIEVAKLFRDAKLRKDKLADRKTGDVPVADSEDAVASDNQAMQQFALPAFKRFAKQYSGGSVIICEGEPGNCFYMIQSGRVQLVKNVNGINKNLDVLKPGELFGEMAILDNSPRSATCVAMSGSTPVECLEFNKENFELLVMGNPRIAIVLLKSFCKRIYDQKRQLRTLSIKDPQARLADVFLMLDELNPVDAKVKTNERKFNITKEDLAHWTGLPAEEAHDEITHMIERHRIEVFDKSITVIDIVDMKRMVEARMNSSSQKE